jgi:hypothetical protein
MWILSNDTPFAAERTIVADKIGSDVWVVAVKGTFLIRTDGTTVLADEQVPIVPFPVHKGDPVSTSLVYESDLDYTKPTTDILLHAQAHAVNGKPATDVEVSMRVGPLSKTLRVFGDRRWTRGLFGLRLGEPEPFLTMPITYERAFGGTDMASENPRKRGWEPENPVGTGFAIDPESLEGKLGPNVEAPGQGRSRRPTGFGPLARHWAPRVGYAGTYDDRWREQRFPLLPRDFDERFFQSAPSDQRSPEYLSGKEEVELRNLTPEGTLKFQLPRVALRFTTRLDRRLIDHRARLHTVVLEPEVPRVLMVWHTSLPCHGKKLKLEGTTIVRKPYIN